MNKKNRSLINWGLGLGIASMFFNEFFIVPLSALIVNYIALLDYDYTNININNDKYKEVRRGFIGFGLGAIYFLVFLYKKEEKYGYSTDIVEAIFARQALIFLIIVACFIYPIVTKYRKANRLHINSSSQKKYKQSVENSQLNQKKLEEATYKDIPDLIIKLSEMVDRGILTKEEFDAKKKELLKKL